MKIQKVLVSCNKNPLYFDFWTPFSYVWKEKFGVDPVLIFIDKNPDSVELDDRWGEVIRVRSIDGIPEYLQTQWSRFYFTNRYSDEVCMTSDIDMFPLSKEYFIKNISDLKLDNDGHVHLNGNGITGKYDDWFKGVCNLSVCYHANYGNRFAEVFDMCNDWENEIQRLHDMKLGRDQSQWAEHLKGMDNWGAEEDYTTSVLRSKVSDKSIKFFTCGLYGLRFDRGWWNDCKSAINTVPFVDCHSIRPYAENKEEIISVLKHYHGDMSV